MEKKKKFIIATTIPLSFIFFKGQVNKLKEEFDVELVSSPGPDLDQFCKSHDLVGHSLPMKRNISVFNDMISLIRFVLLFIRLRPKIVHGNTPKAGLLSMFASWLTFIPHRIYYVHGLRYQGSTGLKRNLLILMERMACFFATNIYAVSYGLIDQLKEDIVRHKQVKIIGNGSINGIDLDYYSRENPEIPEITSPEGLAANDFVFGFIGRLVNDKGINELVHAFCAISKVKKDCKLLLVGWFEDDLDPLGSGIKKEILDNPGIIWVGFQSDIRPYIKLMDLLVFPSYREGFGLALIEAASMGVPAISSDITGCREIIDHGKNGLLVPPKSAVELEKAMIGLYEDRQLLGDMGRNSRRFVAKKYEQKSLWEKAITEYKSLII